MWVLKTTSGSLDMKNVSCISLAGWFSGKFNAVKLYQSFSISGPSSILNPMSLKLLPVYDVNIPKSVKIGMSEFVDEERTLYL